MLYYNTMLKISRKNIVALFLIIVIIFININKLFKFMKIKSLFLASFLSLFSMSGAYSANECDIVIKNRKFADGNLKMTKTQDCQFELKSGEKIRLNICNQDNSVAEFESHDLHIEKILSANKSTVITIKPLKTGQIYNFVEEFGGAKCSFKAI